MRMVAAVVARLLGGSAVVAEPVGLDDETEVGPVEVDFESVEAHSGDRQRQVGVAQQSQEAALEL